MVQFYFLSILLNAVTGYILIMENEEANTKIEKLINFSIDNETIRLILGIATMATGLLKLLSSIQGDIPIIGDLIPALAGLLAGFILVFEYYKNRSNADPEKTEKLEHTLVKNRKWIGYVAMAVAVLHFLFPGVLFL